MSAVSGHVTYTDYIKSSKSNIDGFENIELDENEFIDRVITHMKEHNFI